MWLNEKLKLYISLLYFDSFYEKYCKNKSLTNLKFITELNSIVFDYKRRSPFFEEKEDDNRLTDSRVIYQLTALDLFLIKQSKRSSSILSYEESDFDEIYIDFLYNIYENSFWTYLCLLKKNYKITNFVIKDYKKEFPDYFLLSYRLKMKNMNFKKMLNYSMFFNYFYNNNVNPKNFTFYLPKPLKFIKSNFLLYDNSSPTFFLGTITLTYVFYLSELFCENSSIFTFKNFEDSHSLVLSFYYIKYNFSNTFFEKNIFFLSFFRIPVYFK